MQLGFIGLGKMGMNMAERLMEKGHEILAFDPNKSARDGAKSFGVKIFDSPQHLIEAMEQPRVFWVMVPHEVVEKVIGELAGHLDEGDTIIDGGNTLYRDSVRHANELAEKGLKFLDVGVSGGPSGARNGSCLMIGGERREYEILEGLFRDLAVDHGYGYMGRHGAGHFVKMVHNAIEYGMMQAVAEGFAVMKESEFDLNLKQVSDLYNHGSVIESRLVGWLKDGFDEFGQKMEGVSGEVGRSGEGDWAIDVAREMGISAPVLQAAVEVRKESHESPSYTGKLLSAMRNRFGGHNVK